MPRYVIDEAKLEANLRLLASVRERAGVKILLAQKAFSCAAVYPLCAKYLDGTTASSLFEAKHGHDNFGGETHVFAPAFMPDEMDELLGLVDHIVFNSPRQIEKFGTMARAAGVSVGLRVNPEVSVATTPAYDPCRPGSRLGTTRATLEKFLGDSRQPTNDNHQRPDLNPPSSIIYPLSSIIYHLPTVSGLHFHCLCEQGVEELRKVLTGFEAKFGDLLPQMEWVNFGGGHHITRADYDVEGLVALLIGFRRRYPHLTVYLEPGEAIALNAGTLESRILEIQPPGADGISNAILDISAACHMPDVLEMPYTPKARVVDGELRIGEGRGTGESQASDIVSDCRLSVVECPPAHTYRFGGPTCLAGDTIGVYSSEQPLHEGDTVIFEDMAIYSMVKNNTFNGVNLPDIALRRRDGRLETLRIFGYADFASRLG